MNHRGCAKGIVAVIALALVGCSDRSPDIPEEPALGLGTDLTGRHLELADYRGKVIVVNFWASWCPPCRPVLRSLDSLRADHPERVAIVAANQTESADSVSRYVDRTGLQLTMTLDPDHSVMRAITDSERIPTAVVFDRNGIRHSEALGPARIRDDVWQAVELLLDE